MSTHSFNFCINEDPSHVRHVELSCFDDPERGVWGMTYKTHYSETTVAEAPNTTHKRKRSQ
jgi:hypothetical protein